MFLTEQLLSGIWLGERQLVADCYVAHLHADHQRVLADTASFADPGPERRAAWRSFVLGVRV